MENALKVIKTLSPTVTYPSHTDFIDNLNREEMEWYDTFRTHISERISRRDFTGMLGRNVRTLLPMETIAAMLILAEGYGWSDAMTVKECHSNVRVRHALGLRDAKDVPSEEMVEAFRILLQGHRKATGVDVMNELKMRLTAERGPVRRLGSGRLMLWAMQVA